MMFWVQKYGMQKLEVNSQGCTLLSEKCQENAGPRSITCAAGLSVPGSLMNLAGHLRRHRYRPLKSRFSRFTNNKTWGPEAVLRDSEQNGQKRMPCSQLEAKRQGESIHQMFEISGLKLH